MAVQPSSLAIIGTGRVAEAFVKFFSSNPPFKLIVIGRNLSRLNYFKITYDIEVSDDYSQNSVDWAIVAVNDSSLSEVVPKVKAQLISLTAGTADWKSFGPTCTIFYPLQTFAYINDVNLSFVPILIDGQQNVLAHLTEIAKKKGFNTQPMSLEKRDKIHLVAVFLNNFVHHLMAMGITFAKEFDLNPDLFKPLINETFNRFDYEDPFVQQTGPAIRNDELTLEKHKKLLTLDNQVLYEVLTTSIKSVIDGKL